MKLYRNLQQQLGIVEAVENAAWRELSVWIYLSGSFDYSASNRMIPGPGTASSALLSTDTAVKSRTNSQRLLWTSQNYQILGLDHSALPRKLEQFSDGDLPQFYHKLTVLQNILGFFLSKVQQWPDILLLSILLQPKTISTGYLFLNIKSLTYSKAVLHHNLTITHR